MSAFHGLLGQLLLVLGIAVAVCAVLAMRASADRSVGLRLARLTDVLVVVAVVSTALAMALGPLLMITGKSPDQGLHVILGIVATAALPVSLDIGWWRGYDQPGSMERQRWAALGGIVLAAASALLILSG